MRHPFTKQVPINWRYAMGEISIIVIGIRIALAVDTAMNPAARRGAKQTTLRGWRADLRRDTAIRDLASNAG
jgi:hypothetical protein